LNLSSSIFLGSFDHRTSLPAQIVVVCQNKWSHLFNQRWQQGLCYQRRNRQKFVFFIIRIYSTLSRVWSTFLPEQRLVRAYIYSRLVNFFFPKSLKPYTGCGGKNGKKFFTVAFENVCSLAYETSSRINMRYFVMFITAVCLLLLFQTYFRCPRFCKLWGAEWKKARGLGRVLALASFPKTESLEPFGRM